MGERPRNNDFNDGQWVGLWSELEARCLKSERERDEAIEVARALATRIREYEWVGLGNPAYSLNDLMKELRFAERDCPWLREQLADATDAGKEG
jgi:hypothetical protein